MMQILTFEIEGEPVTWLAHAGYGRKAFNPRFKEKEYVQWKIKEFWHPRSIFLGPVKITYAFFFTIPKSFSKKKVDLIVSGVLQCMNRKDCSNCVKFYEDCLKKIVIEDDCQVVESVARKWYARDPRTVITIEPIEETWKKDSSTLKSSTISSAGKRS